MVKRYISELTLLVDKKLFVKGHTREDVAESAGMRSKLIDYVDAGAQAAAHEPAQDTVTNTPDSDEAVSLVWRCGSSKDQAGLDAVRRLVVHHAAQGQGVDAHVQQGAPGQIGSKQPAFGIHHRKKAEVCRDVAHLANGAACNQFRSLPHGRQETGPHGLHQKQLLFPGLFDHPPGLHLVDGEGLFAQDVLARLQAGEHRRLVEGVGGAT